MRCGDCKFYVGIEGVKKREDREKCRRYPPQGDDWLAIHDSELLRGVAWSLRTIAEDNTPLHKNDDLNLEATETTSNRWPYVDENDWCGEFQPK